MTTMSNAERRVLATLRSDQSTWFDLTTLMNEGGFADVSMASGAAQGLVEAGFAEVDEEMDIEIGLGEEGLLALERGLVEHLLIEYITQSGGEISMTKLQETGPLERHELGPAIGQLKRLGMQMNEGNVGISSDELKSAEKVIQHRMAFLHSIIEAEGTVASSLEQELLEHFLGRSNFIERKERVSRRWRVSGAGAGLSDADLEESEDIGIYSVEDLQQASKLTELHFRPYDVSLEAQRPLAGRPHPMQRLIDRVRSIFIGMGFQEIEGNVVQSVGWNMDALFIPQDHPAREMQDTYYLSNPEHISLPDKFLNTWKEAHEHGANTGSTGWGGIYNNEMAEQAQLRTHTTVLTIRHLAENPNDPCQIFSIGRVFRNEALDRTHLPEFHQIEGIVMSPDASLSMLIGTLRTFFEEVGFDDVRVRPAYFPYTEPSLEVEVQWRGQWLELGGAGVFRPEVTEPLGCAHPVIAWGMGLERLAMLTLGLDDIRQLYTSDLRWLDERPVL